jgi:HEPN domain-containing protein
MRRKSLKAYIIAKEIEPPRTHDLVELNNLCTVHESGFSNMRQYCAFLNPYGVHVRYPNELAVDDTITKCAIENAQKLFDFCDNVIKVVHGDSH